MYVQACDDTARRECVGRMFEEKNSSKMKMWEKYLLQFFS